MSQEYDRIIKLVQSSTRNILSHYRERAEVLRECTEDVKLLIREGHDPEIAQKTAKRLFGTTDDISFLAIDGTKSQDEALEMVIFYAGAFGYISKLNFSNNKGCTCSEPIAVRGTLSLSTAIPVHEENISSVAGQLKEGGIDVDAERIPSGLMHLAEYFLAVRALYEDSDIKVVIFDRMPSIDIPHLISNVEELLDKDNDHNDRCVLEGLETEHGVVSILDLELARMLHPNGGLEIPSPRSQLIRYAAINKLINEQKIRKDNKSIEGKPKNRDRIKSYEDLLKKTGANRNRLGKLKKDLTNFDRKYSLFDKTGKSRENHQDESLSLFELSPNIENYWQRVLAASMKVAEHIFNTPDNQYPLLYQKEILNKNNNKKEGNNDDGSKKGKKEWITANDIDYLILVMIYALLRLAWEKNILVLGLVKDIAAADMIKTVVPLLQSSGNLSYKKELPKFNSDKMLLQTASVINAQSTSAPWSTFEFDTCFKTVAPLIDDNPDTNNKLIEKQQEEKIESVISPSDQNIRANNTDNRNKNNHNYVNVAGAFKNLISGERLFLKSYIQLWSSKTDPTVRSHVFCYDRPCYPDFDRPGEISLYHNDGNVVEEIKPIMHFNSQSDISHLVMDILCSMSLEVIPECIGHNYPLFLADKKAKSILDGTKSAYISTVSLEISKSQFDQQTLFESKFRDYRSQIEHSRKGGK